MTEKVIKQAEQLTNLTDPQINLMKIFCYQRYCLRKSKTSRRSSIEILNLFSEDDDFIGEDALTTKFSIFTKKKLLDIYGYIEKFTSQNTSEKEFSLRL